MNLATRLEGTGAPGNLRLEWPAGHTLQRAGSLNPATWNEVQGAASPWKIPDDREPGCFRIVRLP